MRSSRSALLCLCGLAASACGSDADEAPESQTPPNSGCASGKCDTAAPECERATVSGLFKGWKESPTTLSGSEIPATVAVVVQDLALGTRWSINETKSFESASAFKTMYVAAALARTPDFLEADAKKIFVSSDNAAAGRAIDAGGGACVVDDFLYCRGKMDHSALRSFDGRTCSAITASACGKEGPLPNATGLVNHFTAADVVEFLGRLDKGQLFDASQEAACSGGCKKRLYGWMTLAPHDELYGPLATDLGSATVRHKVGLIADPSWVAHDAGIVELPNGGKRYAIAVLTHAPTAKWLQAQARIIRRVSREVYTVMRGDGNSLCGDPCVNASDGDGSYCGQTLGGMSAYRYDCAGGKTTGKELCSGPCIVAPPNSPDACP